MANSQAPFGLRPVKSGAGEMRVNYYPLSSTSAQVYEGDTMVITSGKAVKCTTAAATLLLGVAARESGTIVAGGIAKFPVLDDPSQEYTVQGTSAATATSIGLTCPLTLGTLTNYAGQSVQSADVLSAQASGYSVTYPLIILGLTDRPNNSSGNYAEVRVKIHSHLLSNN